MSIRTVLFASLVVFTASCHRQASPIPAPTPPEPGSQKPIPGITVEGDGLSPEGKRAIGALARDLLSDAINKALSANIEEVYRALKVSDDFERTLIFGSNYDFGSPNEDDDTLSIILIRPNEFAQAPETVEWIHEGRALIRITRANAEIDRPVAIVTRNRISQWRLIPSDLVLFCNPEGNWETIP